MGMIWSCLESGTEEAEGLAACSDDGPKIEVFIRTSERCADKQMSLFKMLAPVLRPASEQNRQKRARTRAECVTIPKREHPNMPLTLWGAGGGADWPPSLPPKARPNRLQTRQGEKTARWCTWTYIEGESLKPNDVSNDLERFEKRMIDNGDMVILLYCDRAIYG